MFFLFLIAIAAILVIILYNRIITRKNNVVRSWSDVAVYQRQKTKLIPDLERLTRDYLSFEKQLHSDVTALRAAIDRVRPDRIDLDALREAEQSSERVLAGFRAVAEAYPDLQSATVMRDLMAEMVELEENIAAAITIFNRNVSDFNTGIEIFPNSLVNALLTKIAPYPAFRDSAGERDIEYQFRG